MAENRPIPLLDDSEANPYNARKDYDDDGAERILESADSLYVPKRQAKEPEESPEATSEQDQGTDNHDYKKRWSDLKKLRDQEKVAWKAEREEIESRLKKLESEPATPPEDKVKLKAWIEANPDLFEMVQAVARDETAEGTKTVKEQLEDISKREQQLAQKTAKQEVLEVHPDLDDITNDDNFHDWAESQPEAIQSMIYDNPSDSRSLIAALNFYKQAMGMGQSKDQPSGESVDTTDGADAMVSVRSNSEPVSDKKIWTRKEIDSMPMEVFDKYEEEINLAVYEGRVV